MVIKSVDLDQHAYPNKPIILATYSLLDDGLTVCL